MTQVTDGNGKSSLGYKLGVLFIAIALLVVLLLPPVKNILNSIPYFWSVIYPVLTLVSLYVLIKAVIEKQGAFELIKWTIFLISAASMTAAKYGLGSIFFTAGRILAVIFIVLELATFALDIFDAS